MNSSKLYVGGLPFSISDGRLEEIFSAHGTVDSARVVTDRISGRSRGFGFVEMGSPSEAQIAIERLHNTELDGRTLVVNEAKPRENRSGFGDFGGNNRQGRKRW